MMSMAASDLRSIGQAGTTIGLGLLFDTLIVRSLMTPSIAALLGRWFWWPQRVRPRPASYMLRPFGPRRLVRSLLLGEDADAVPTKLQSPFCKDSTLQRLREGKSAAEGTAYSGVDGPAEPDTR
jgi:RND superfamily putative drug exporter